MMARADARPASERAAIRELGREKSAVEFCERVSELRARDGEAHRSFVTIPRFCARGSRSAEGSRAAAEPSRAALLRAVAEARCLRALEASILSWDELERLRVRLCVSREAQSAPSDDSRRINYEALCSARRDLRQGAAESGSESESAARGDVGGSSETTTGSVSSIFDRELSARRFLDLPRDQHGRVSARELYNRVDRATCVAKLQLALRPYDGSRRGWLREHELERYIYDLIPDMALGASMDEKFHAFYVFTAVRRFMFFLDAKRRGRISIETLAASAISTELLEVAEANASDVARGGVLAQSWFLPEHAKRVYSDYLELDEDHNGMLSKSELLNFRGRSGEARLTSAFVERVFSEIITYRTNEATGEGEMDFKTYLDLVLAFESVQHSHALAYFWRLLDVRDTNCLDTFAINYFFRDIAAALRHDGFDAPSTADVVDEIFDMVKPKNKCHITFEDLIASGVADTVVTMLVDVTGFLAYDNREHQMQGADEED